MALQTELSELVFPLKEATAFRTTDRSTDKALVAISKKGEVIITGPEVASMEQSVQGPQNLRALARTYAASDRSIKLFDEIFGASALADNSRPQQASLTSLSAVNGTGTDIFAETPSHKLLNIASLAGGLLAQGLRPLDQFIPAKASTLRAGREADVESDDDEAEPLSPLNHDLNGDVAMQGGELAVPSSAIFTDSPAGLVEIFKKSISVSTKEVNGSTAAPVTPLGGKKDPRMAGNDSGRKALKKKKSLSSMFGGAKARVEREGQNYASRKSL